MERKPPARVRAIDGKGPSEDVITESEYAEIVRAQDATLYAQAYERKLLGRLTARPINGARSASGRYYFDPDRGIVRRLERLSGS